MPSAYHRFAALGDAMSRAEWFARVPRLPRFVHVLYAVLLVVGLRRSSPRLARLFLTLAVVTLFGGGAASLWAPSTALALAWTVTPGSGGACTVGDPNCATIQAAVTAASPGDTINVAAGTYNERVVVDKTLTINGAQVGVDARTRPGTSGESVITFACGPVQVIANNVVLNGFSIQDATTSPNVDPGCLGAAIHTSFFVGGNFGFRFLNNIIQNNIVGIYLNSAANATQTVVQRNSFRNNNQSGPAGGNSVYSDQGLSNVLIDSNGFTGATSAGINLSGGSGTQFNVTISNNTMTNGDRIVLFNLTSSSISGNMLSGMPQSGAIVPAGGVNGLTITSNTISNNTNRGIRVGDFLGGSPNVNVTAHFNRIVGNHWAAS